MLGQRAFVERARSLLSSGESTALRYAALELRMCLEAITYEKLRAYARRLPADLLRKWKAPVAMRQLLELEPDAEKDYTIAIAEEPGPGIPAGRFQVLGEHRSLRASWLDSTYRKLGSILHAANPNAPRTAGRMPDADLRTFLEQTAERLEHVVQGNVTATMGDIVEFTCSLCGGTVVGHADAISKRRTIVCLAPECQAEYLLPEGSDQELRFVLNEPRTRCQHCDSSIPVPKRRCRIGVEFACQKCGRGYRITGQRWVVTPIENEAGGISPAESSSSGAPSA